MAMWLVENIVWVGIAAVLFLVLGKVLVGRWLKRLMDNSSSTE